MQSADTDVSRWAIEAWASRTWAFDSANFLPPLRPRGREPGQGAFADQLPLELGQRREDAEHEAAGRRGGVDLRALPGEHPQAHAAGSVLGFDIDHASKRLDLSSLETEPLPVRSAWGRLRGGLVMMKIQHRRVSAALVARSLAAGLLLAFGGLFAAGAQAQSIPALSITAPLIPTDPAVNVRETDGSVVLTVELDPASSGTVTVDYFTIAGNAQENQDYAGTSGTLTFAAGNTSRTITVPISMYRKRPFATGGRGRLQTSAVVCRIPCRILCVANVERMSRLGWSGALTLRPA